ncbi:MAG: polysaccharide biosynthesis tyrosine autokinase, partial [bacterium]|nr:polysaccharide biosynthesis tyrosine autokinase [bacterium]
NTLIEVYQELHKKFISEDATTRRMFIELQLNSVESDLKESEEALKNFKLQENLIDAEIELESFISSKNSLESMYLQNKVRLITIEESLKQIDKIIRQNPGSAPTEINTDSVLSGYQQALTNLEMELVKLKAVYQSTDPKIIEVENQISELRSKISSRASSLYSASGSEYGYLKDLFAEKISLNIEQLSLIGQNKALEEILKEYKTRYLSFPEKELEYYRLKRKVAVGEKIYSILLESYKQAQISEASVQTSIKVIDEAEPPTVPLPTNKTNIIVFSLIIGIVGSVISALLLENLDTTIKTGEEIEHLFKIPVIGYIPQILRESETEKLLKKFLPLKRVTTKRIMAENLISKLEPHSPVSEAYRTMRTNFSYLMIDNPSKLFLITSSEPKEGKSITISNLAITFARNNQKTLLVDCDLRKPSIHRIFNLENRIGLTNYLITEISGLKLKDIIIPSEFQNLDIITCGKLPPNPAELLNSNRMIEFLNEVRGKYDIVLIDSPPVGAVTDASVLAPQCDSVLFVIKAASTARERVNHSLKLIQRSQVKTIAAVLNQIPVEGGYGYYYYYYYYTYYYGSDDEKKK